ncbi:hypothetical protein FY550_14710 [Kushneria phosphatilytica]|uniref:Uncharacterized protein n=2 Tax=Kushneria phosphatilytica TaxID=657387 RepID=A0A5C1A5M1_9GAMM|nr:hypothetical protein FY550_14710 [Kushneria phosphatilytica]
MPRAIRNAMQGSLSIGTGSGMKARGPSDKPHLGRRFGNAMGSLRHRIMQSLPDRLHIALRYRRVFGRFPNLRHPQTFNEKICYRKLHPEPSYSILSDKVAARDHVAGVIGSEHLVPCHAVCSELTPDIYHGLPDSFVMKANHGFGYNLLVRNKQDYPYPMLYNLSQAWLREDFSKISREAHYHDIKPRLIIEQLLLDESGNVPKDFKFHCFRRTGESPVVFVEVTHDRFSDYRVDFYDQDWNMIEVREDRFSSGKPMARPALLDEAQALALKLSEGFSYVRVDFYLVNGQIYFGELTFTPTAGLMKFKHHQTDVEWGRLFEL